VIRVPKIVEKGEDRLDFGGVSRKAGRRGGRAVGGYLYWLFVVNNDPMMREFSRTDAKRAKNVE